MLDKAAAPRAALVRLPYAQYDRLLGVDLFKEADARSRTLQADLRTALDRLLPTLAKTSDRLRSGQRKAQARAQRDL
jgi:hypothetical protein